MELLLAFFFKDWEIYVPNNSKLALGNTAHTMVEVALNRVIQTLEPTQS